MDTEKTDQQMFDEQVNRTGRVVLQILAGVGIVAALMISTVALIRSGNQTTMTMAPTSQVVAKTPAATPSSASLMIEHTTRGCHTMVVNGALPASPTKTIHLAPGGTLHVVDNDVMPHKLLSSSGPGAQFTGATMSHMGARSTVTFPTAGTYSLTTKAGEDYMKGVQTIGPDNTLRIKVVVGTPAAAGAPTA